MSGGAGRGVWADPAPPVVGTGLCGGDPGPGHSAVFAADEKTISKFHRKIKKGLDFFRNCDIILSVPNGGIAQLVRAHASHA